MTETRDGAAPLLDVRDLAVSFRTDDGVVQAVDGVSFSIAERSVVALVGESGCGKSVTAQAILRLLPEPPAMVRRGEILLNGRDLLKVSERDLREVRGGAIGFVFQEPMTALNPVYTIGFQVEEAVALHLSLSRRERRARVLELLRRVAFPEPERGVDLYPHELSGGMRQRVLIAIAIACDPALVIADEPTTALDATLAAQIMELLADLRRDRGTSLLLVAHDLRLVANVADEIVVLYAGWVVERGPAAAVLAEPKHPYTRALLESVPPARSYRVRGKTRAKLPVLAGQLPDLREPPTGCRFHARCPIAIDRCKREVPQLLPLAMPGAPRFARCFLAEPEHAASIAPEAPEASESAS